MIRVSLGIGASSLPAPFTSNNHGDARQNFFQYVWCAIRVPIAMTKRDSRHNLFNENGLSRNDTWSCFAGTRGFLHFLPMMVEKMNKAGLFYLRIDCARAYN
jgi:hypothetical protein